MFPTCAVLSLAPWTPAVSETLSTGFMSSEWWSKHCSAATRPCPCAIRAGGPAAPVSDAPDTSAQVGVGASDHITLMFFVTTSGLRKILS